MSAKRNVTLIAKGNFKRNITLIVKVNKIMTKNSLTITMAKNAMTNKVLNVMTKNFLELQQHLMMLKTMKSIMRMMAASSTHLTCHWHHTIK